jgi:predicted nucleotide-binding protein
MKPTEELLQIAKTLKSLALAGEASSVVNPLEAIRASATDIGRSFSGSWLGYHSKVYYADFVAPPPRANFSQEWGLKDLSLTSLGSLGDWRQYDPVDVKARIRKAVGSVDLTDAKAASQRAADGFASAKLEILSVLENEMHEQPDKFLERLKGDLEKLDVLSGREIANLWSPKGQFMTRDSLAAGQGNQVPPHIQELADIASFIQSFETCRSGAQISEKAASHLERKNNRKRETDRIGTNVFIGHGRSSAWRELKDFVQDRLSLPWDEFNRIPVAGITNIARLSAMLDAAAIAFLVMTAEDALEDGEVQARLNVVHEAGLFQGRLGFTKAIILIEDGCKEFSNIQGLGQIRFPKNNVAAAFEEIRRVLEREGLIDA